MKNTYKQNTMKRSSIVRHKTTQGETIEQRVERIMHSGEKIKDSAPLIYEDRGAGVNPAHNIRTDRWEIALEARDAQTASHIAKRQTPAKPEEPGTQDDPGPKTDDGKPKP